MKVSVLIVITIFGSLISNLISIIFYYKIFKQKMLSSLLAIKLIEKESLKIGKSFIKKVFYKNACYLLILFIPSTIISITLALLWIFLEINEMPYFLRRIIGLLNFIFCSPFLILFLKNINLLKYHDTSYRLSRLDSCNQIFFFENKIINEEKYKNFLIAIEKEIYLKFLDWNGKSVKSLNLEKIKNFCYKKKKFNAFSLDYLLFVDPKYLKINDLETDLENLSYLRYYLRELLLDL
ncbi:hypothetical protein [Metamycoplasma equirhinis]|uniref:hypothetical protein n=1 Tax=Metamycoplasma equirhinis TaxID=92402 RepID=UPI00359C4030